MHGFHGRAEAAVSVGSSESSPSPAPLAPGFEELGLCEPLLRALSEEGYSHPTPVQAEAIPHVLAGRDLLASAQTGTGKTAAFLLPLIERLGPTAEAGRVRILVLSPTRELASQIADRAEAYGRHVGLRHAVILGGVRQRAQEQALRRGPALVVATPGRLLDLMGQRLVRLDSVDAVVLDEADRMLDMGFMPDVRRILSALPSERQTLFFSATMPGEVTRLARNILRDPVSVAVARPEETAEVDQAVCFVSSLQKRAALERCLRSDEVVRALVFTRTKRSADGVATQLERAGIGATAIHGDKAQKDREKALESFRSGTTPVLVATDVAARGIDVKGITHVINYELPDSAETYVHRIGRTARAGAVGKAISLCDVHERGQLFDIERTLKRRIAVMDAPSGDAGGADLPVAVAQAEPAPPRVRPDPSKSYGGRRRGRGLRLR